MWAALGDASMKKVKAFKASNWEEKPSAAPDQKREKEGEVTRTKEFWSWNRTRRTWKQLCSWVSWVEEHRHFPGMRSLTPVLPSGALLYLPLARPSWDLEGKGGEGGCKWPPEHRREGEYTGRHRELSQRGTSDQFSYSLFPTVKSEYPQNWLWPCLRGLQDKRLQWVCVVFVGNL